MTNYSLFIRKSPGIMREIIDDFDLTAIQAAAILGNIGHECAGFLQMQEKNPRGGRGGYGWCQWTASRRLDFEAWCRRMGLSVSSDEANYGFLKHELTATWERRAIPLLKRTTRLTTGVRTFEQAYLRAAADAKHYPSREQYAQIAHDAFRAADAADAVDGAETGAFVSELLADALAADEAEAMLAEELEMAGDGADAADDGPAQAAADAASVELLYRFTGVRDRPVTNRLATLLKLAAARAGIDRIVIYSGGQPGTTGQSTGSPRHNGGNAADLHLFVRGRVQRFSNDSAPQTITDFVTEAARLGATGIGAATDYMGPTSLHVGYGMPRTVWGRNGRRVNAPAWLVQAFNAGLGGGGAVADAGTIAQSYTVVARRGAPLRAGPGSEYDTVETINPDTSVSVLAIDGPDGDWARVDLVGDGYVDGHLHISTLSPAGGALVADHVENVDGDVPPEAEER